MTSPRKETTERWQHLTARCVDGRKVIVDDDDSAERYLETFGEVATQRGWVVITYCVMGNHVHLVLWTPQADLGRGMKTVQESFAIYANHRDGLLGRGHFWSGRYFNQHIETEDHAAATMRYVARNPVSHGVRDDAGAWPHSAHRALLGDVACPSWLRRDVALALVGGVHAYAALTAKDDQALVAELLDTFGPAEGVRRAVDVHRIAGSTVLGRLGCSESTFYRRLREGREAHRAAVAGGVVLLRASA